MTSLSSVLIVDDEPAVRELMARWVTSLGLRPKTASSADEALEALREQHCDLAVIDVMMPGHDGLWLATQLQRDHPHTAVVIATAYTELLDGDAGQRPIADMLVKPFQRDRFALAVDRGRQWRKETLEEVQWHARLSGEVAHRAAHVIAVVAGRAPGVSEAVALNAIAVERMPETMAHSERVCRFAHAVARELGMEQELGATLELGGRFHDIGKVAMPEALLTKPSPLTPGELGIMRRHVALGAEILEATETLAWVAPLVMTSHEWFNGGGYPNRLAGSNIPLATRIITVVDAYDAMTQDRSYRMGTHAQHAVAELLRCTPTQFDPEVVTAFLAVLGTH
jgi:putative two-component system response regulator